MPFLGSYLASGAIRYTHYFKSSELFDDARS